MFYLNFIQHHNVIIMRLFKLLCGLMLLGFQLLYFPRLFSQEFFSEPVLLQGTAGGVFLKPLALDLDADGDLDILRQVWETNTLISQENLGGNTWGGEAVFATQLPNLTSVENHDIDADGLDDLVLVTHNEHRLYCMRQESPGVWSSPEPISGSMLWPYDFAVGDIDSDGLPDVVEMDWSGELAWYKNMGSYFDPEPRFISNRPYPREGKFTDFNGDGKIELFVGHHNGNGIWMYEYAAESGSWTETLVLAGNSMEELSFVDTDYDGYFELIADIDHRIMMSRFNGEIWEQSMLFDTGSQISDFLVIQNPTSLEVILSRNSANSVSSWKSSDSGWYQDWNQNVQGALYVELVELYEDGIPFLVLTKSIGGEVRLVPLEFADDLSNSTPINSNNTDAPWRAVWAQIDSDAELEVVVAGSGSNSVVWYDHSGGNLWSSARPITQNVINPSYLEVGDLDGDGDDDFLITAQGESRVLWIESLGGGQFSNIKTISTVLNSPSMSRWVDLDNDLDLDVVTISAGDRRVVSQLNNGSQQFSPVLNIVAPSDHVPVDLEFGDVDDNGLVDVLIGYQYELGVAKQVSSGNFEYTTIGKHSFPGESQIHNLQKVLLHDLNGDGQLDVIAVCWWGGVIAVFEGSENGFNPGYHFSTRHPNRDVPLDAKSWMSILDLDQDGFSDMVYTQNANEWPQIIRGKAFSEFHKKESLFSAQFSDNSNESNFRFPDFADFDQDGDLDAVVSHPWRDWVVVSKNDSHLMGCNDSSACNYQPSAQVNDGSCKYVGENCDDGLSYTYNDQISDLCLCLGSSFENEVIYRINVGYTSGVVVDEEGNSWQPEAFVIGGAHTATVYGIHNTLSDSIYRWSRYALDGLDIPLSTQGTYLVRLHWGCIRWEVNSPGFQVFDVKLEDQMVKEDLDLWSENGGEGFKRYVLEEIVVVNDGVLNVRLPAKVWQNELSGIEVFRYSGECVDVDLDNICDALEVFGCTYSVACNFNPEATQNDGSCSFVECAGCMDQEACNYDLEASIPDNSCTYPAEHKDCSGNCVQDIDQDGTCDQQEILGCTYPFATNYSPAATQDDNSCVFEGYSESYGCTYPNACNFDIQAIIDDGSCQYPEIGRNCEGICFTDSDGDGICDELEGCTLPGACNFNPIAVDNNGCCLFPDFGLDCDGNCDSDIDGDGICDSYEVPGCTDVNACNYSQIATDDSGDCFFAPAWQNCDGSCILDADLDGVCDELEILGCMDFIACNYEVNATESDGSCLYSDAFLDCAGNCLNDSDGDLVCDESEISGCTYAEAVNFSSLATHDDGSCLFDSEGFVFGCFYAFACNYSSTATQDDGSCNFPELGYDCDGNCLNDCDGDGICDQFEVLGCTNQLACNFLVDATESVDNCEFISCSGCMNPMACNYDPSALYSDDNCEFLTCAGCTNDWACNFSPSATIDNGECDYESCLGCTYSIAVNFDPSATIDDGSCAFNFGNNIVESCLGDLDEDLSIGTSDLLILLGVFETNCD